MAYGFRAEAGIDVDTEELVVRAESEMGVTTHRTSLTEVLDVDYLRIDDNNVVHIEQDGEYGSVQLEDDKIW